MTIWMFWLFNILMVLWIWGGMSNNMEKIDSMSGAERAGAQIGTGIGVMLLITIWVFGVVILGIMALLTRPRS